MSGSLRDAVYGAAVGDALGVPYEFMSRGSFECTGMVGGGAHNQPAGTFSDDTSLILATCASLKAKSGKVDVEDMRNRFLDWYLWGEYAIDGIVYDVGLTTAMSLSTGVGGGSVRDNGNGSLMRIIPLAFVDAGPIDVYDVSGITHDHEIAKMYCWFYVCIARHLAAGYSIEESVMPDRRWFTNTPIDSMDRDTIMSGGYVVDTYEAALWCLCNTDTYADCVLEAVNLGEDTDTTACVAGALAGIVYGYDAIPAEWITALRGKDLIEDCLFKL